MRCAPSICVLACLWTACIDGRGGEAGPDLAAAVRRAPAVVAAQHRVAAARMAARGAGVLPDPMLRIEGMRMPDMHENGFEGMLEQPLPRWGERTATRAMAAADIAMADAGFADAAGRTMMAASIALVDAAAADAEANLDADTARRARALATLMTQAAGAGGAGLREALSLQTRAESMDLMAADRRRMAADARGRARALLGSAPDAPLPSLVLPETQAPSLDRVPDVLMARARALQADAERDMARSRGRPEVSVSVRAKRFPDLPEEDENAAAIGVSIPLYRPAYQAGVDAAAARGDAARREIDGQLLLAREAIARAVRAVDQAQAAARFTHDASERLDRELDTIAAEVATGTAGMTAMLYDRFDQLADARRESIRADAEAQRMRAELWMLAPPTEERP